MITSSRLRQIQSIQRLDAFASYGPIFKRSAQGDDDEESAYPEFGSAECFECLQRGLLESMRQQLAVIREADRMGEEALDALAEHLGIDRANR